MKSPSDKPRNTQIKKAWDAYFEMEKLAEESRNKVTEFIHRNDNMGGLVARSYGKGIVKCMEILKDRFNLKL